MSTLYIEHPVTKKEKKEYLKKFNKLLDVRFAPDKLSEGDKVIKKPKVKIEEQKA